MRPLLLMVLIGGLSGVAGASMPVSNRQLTGELSKRMAIMTQKLLVGGSLIAGLCVGTMSCTDSDRASTMFAQSGNVQANNGASNYDYLVEGNNNVASFSGVVVNSDRTGDKSDIKGGKNPAGGGSAPLISATYNTQLGSLTERIGGGGFSLLLTGAYELSIAGVRGYVYDSDGNFHIYDSHDSGRSRIGSGYLAANKTVMTIDGREITLDFANIGSSGVIERELVVRDPALPLLARGELQFNYGESETCTGNLGACSLPSYSSGVSSISGTGTTYRGSAGQVLVDWAFGNARATLNDVEVSYTHTGSSQLDFDFDLTVSHDGNSEALSGAVRAHPEGVGSRFLVYSGSSSDSFVIGDGSRVDLGDRTAYLINIDDDGIRFIMSISGDDIAADGSAIKVGLEMLSIPSVDGSIGSFRWLGQDANRAVSLGGTGEFDDVALERAD